MDIPKDLLDKYTQQPRGANSERSSVIESMYLIYKAQKRYRDHENWKRFGAWRKANRLPATPEIKERFKKETVRKTGGYIEEDTKQRFAIRLAHLKGDQGVSDLYYCLSVMKDLHMRNANAVRWLFGAIKVKLSTGEMDRKGWRV